MYSQEQVLPLVVREVSALARQRIKVREPTDFLKIQQRVKNDLDSMNHTNAFFRQRYSANYNGSTIEHPAQNTSIIMQTPVVTSPSHNKSPSITKQGPTYRPRPFFDQRVGCLANYDEYLMMRDLDKQNKQ